MQTVHRREALVGGLLAAALLLSPAVAFAETDAEFFQNKTIRIINWVAPGGEYDLHGRLIMRYLARHLPGKPTIIHQTMAGGGGIVAAAHLYNVSPRDGTALGVVSQGLPLFQALGEAGGRYDAAQFNWIGTILPTPDIMVAWHASSAKKFDDLLKGEFALGATGKNSTTYMIPSAMNALLATKIKIVLGYRGGEDLNLAVERGEVMGRINSWSGLKSAKPDWVRDKKVQILVQTGLVAAPDLPDTPLLINLAKSEDDRAIFRMFGITGALGRPLIAPPNMSPERVKALRDGFAAMTMDPEFLAESKRLAIDVAPIRGEELQKMVEGALRLPPLQLKRLKEMME